MEAWTLIAGIILLAISALGMVRHWRNRPEDAGHASAALEGLTPSKNGTAAPVNNSRQEEREFRHRQFRRRMQGSAMIGVLGVMLPLGDLIDSHPWRLAYAGVMLSLVGWMVLLALADLVATRYHFHRVRQQLLSESVAAARSPAARNKPDTTRPEQP
jgi:hypothetical protein